MDLSDDAQKAKLKLQAVSFCQLVIIGLNLNMNVVFLSLHCTLRLDNIMNMCCTCVLFIPQQLSHHLFEELASDVYDEVDRRECDAGIAFNYYPWYNITYFNSGESW